jgi:hypothetical protein
MTLTIEPGQTGTLILATNSKVTLPVTLRRFGSTYIDAHIHGTGDDSTFNSFRAEDWTFTPDAEPLPTRVGSCVRSGSLIASRIVSADSGKHWRVMNDSGQWLSDDELPNPVVLFDAGTVLK